MNELVQAVAAQRALVVAIKRRSLPELERLMEDAGIFPQVNKDLFRRVQEIVKTLQAEEHARQAFLEQQRQAAEAKLREREALLEQQRQAAAAQEHARQQRLLEQRQEVEQQRVGLCRSQPLCDVASQCNARWAWLGPVRRHAVKRQWHVYQPIAALKYARTPPDYLS